MRGLCETQQRLHARQASSAFQPRYYRLRSSHSLGQLRLSQAGTRTCRDQFVRQGKLVPQSVVSRLSRHLQIFGGPESDFLACFDFDRLTGCGITPNAGRPISDL